MTTVQQPAVTTDSPLVAKMLSLFGFALMVIAIGYSFYMLTVVDDKIEVKKGELAELEEQIVPLKKEIYRIRNSPLSKLIIPKAIAICDPTPSVQQLYNIMVWLDLPEVRKAEIQEVQYVFGDSSFLRNRHQSKEPSNGFAIGYLGWGFMTSVPITVIPKKGPEFTIEFRMFDKVVMVCEEDDG